MVVPGYGQTVDRHEVSLGVDLSRFALPLFDSTRYGWEISGDYEILDDLFAIVELGSQTTKFQRNNYSYQSNGLYTRLGADYNYMKHIDDKSNDQLLIGLRYGFTSFLHDARNIIVPDDIWGSYTQESIDRRLLAGNWLEIATGMRTHLFNNFYLSWSARFKIKFFSTNDPVMQAYHVPGFGRDWANSLVGFNYSLYYKIPLIKKRSARKNDKEALKNPELPAEEKLD